MKIYFQAELLGPNLVQKQIKDGEIIIKPVAMLPQIIELTYYSNTVVTHFALESIVAIAIESVVTKTGTVFYSEFIESALELCNLLQYEFIFCKPCQNLEQEIGSCLDDLVVRHRIFQQIDQDGDERVAMSNRIARELEDEEDEAIEKPYVLNKENETSGEYLKYLRGLLMPLVETYSMAALVLKNVVGKTVLENEIVENVLKDIRAQLEEGNLKYRKRIFINIKIKYILLF